MVNLRPLFLVALQAAALAPAKVVIVGSDHDDFFG
jgi:hypothetical protein